MALRPRTITQQFFLWTDLCKALIKECKSEVVEDYLFDWHKEQDDWPGDGHIGKKLNVAKQLAALEKKYASKLRRAIYVEVSPDIDADHDFCVVSCDQLDDIANLHLLRAMAKVLGEHAKGFHIKYDWE